MGVYGAEKLVSEDFVVNRAEGKATPASADSWSHFTLLCSRPPPKGAATT